jgi:hypothetical protein
MAAMLFYIHSEIFTEKLLWQNDLLT